MARQPLCRIRNQPPRRRRKEFRITTIGGVGIVRIADGARLAQTCRKGLALIGMLAIDSTHDLAREFICSNLWSDKSQAKSLGNLRETLRQVHAGGFTALRSEGRSLFLDLAAVEIDLVVIEEAAKLGHVHPSVFDHAPLTEKVLKGYDEADDEFGRWLSVERSQILDRLLRLFEDVMRNRLAQADRREEAARAVATLQPENEAAARTRIAIRADAGDIGAAKSVYDMLCKTLRAGFGAQPSPETKALIERVVQRAQLVPAGPMVGVATFHVQRPQGLQELAIRPSKPIIMLGSLTSADARPNDDHLRAPFRRELMVQLHRFREWHVCDQYNPILPPEPGGEEYVLEGTTTGRGQSARLVLALSHKETGQVVSRASLPFRLSAWRETQREIVRRIATSLNVHISKDRLRAILQRMPNDLTAYDCWLRVEARRTSWSTESWHEAEALLNSIIADAPHFAPAYSSLSALYSTIHFYHPGLVRSDLVDRKGLDAAEKAITLDPTDSRARLALAWAQAFLGKFDPALHNHRVARELNDSDPRTLSSTALGMAFCGKGSERETARRAMEMCLEGFALSPSPGPSEWGYRAQIAFVAREYEDAVASAEKAGRILHFAGWRAAALAELGRIDEARAALKEFYDGARGRWFPTRPSATPETMTEWFLGLHPMRNRATWSRLRDGLVKAGAPRIIRKSGR